MAINRRRFTLLLGTALLSPALLAGTRNPLFASAAKNAQGRYELLIVDSDGKQLHRHPLPARAHHVERHPTHPWVAVIGRRPETFIDIYDYQLGELRQRISSESGYHFYGHGIFSPDGRFLITTENQISSGLGQIVIRDLSQQFSVVARYSSGGIGPHELKLMADGSTLVVANGGILTHPDSGREKLNLNSMNPSLAYIDLHSGEILEQVYMPAALHKLSIRHFDINANGRVVVALQYQGDAIDDVPLIAFHSRSQPLQLARAPAAVNHAMKQYCGSARFDCSGRVAAVSSPRGNLITFWNPEGEFLTAISSRDGCGLSATRTNGEFLISTGRGKCYRYDAHNNLKQKIELSDLNRIAWDNHMASLL